MAKRTYISIPVTGPLNTSDPATNRPAGTLVQAVDADTTSLGPRRGAKQMTWPGRFPTSLALYVPGATPSFSFDGTNTYVKGQLAREQIDLGSRWTLDVAFHAFASRSVNAAVPIFQWKLDSSIIAINLGVYGSTHANANKLYAIVKTTSSPGTASGTYTLVGGTVPYAAVNSYYANGAPTRVMARLVRNGSTLTLIDSIGGAAVADTSLTATDAHAGTTTENGFWYYGADSDLGASHTFNGLLHRAVLRDVAVSTALKPPMIEHCFPRSRSVRFAGSTSYLFGLYVADQSSFGSHGLVSTPGTAPANNTERHYPLSKMVQGMGSFVDQDGIRQSMVMVGGLRAFQRVR